MQLAANIFIRRPLLLLPALLCCCAIAAGAVDAPMYDYETKMIVYGNSPAKVSVHSGTKWCGAGNIAQHYEDLGSAFETDRCCRRHDHCGIYVRPNRQKYGFRNHFFYTISHCECDNDFLNCLLRSRDSQARSVYKLFFHGLRMPCFMLEKRRICTKRSLWDWMARSCSKYETQETAVLMRLPQVATQRWPQHLSFSTKRPPSAGDYGR